VIAMQPVVREAESSKFLGVAVVRRRLGERPSMGA